MNTKLLACLLAATVGSNAALFAQGPRNGPPPPPPDPDTLAAEFFADFDANEDNLLNQEELAAALQNRHEKRMAVMAERRANRANNGIGRPNRPLNRYQQRRQFDSTVLAQSFIEDFDANDDSAMDVQELLGALESNCRPGKRGGPRGGRGLYRAAPPTDESVEDEQ